MKEPEAVIENLVAWLGGRQLHSISELGFFCAGLRPDGRRIQQDLQELQAYVIELRSLEPRNVAVEIGYDRGGTHFIWTQLFSEVISIESNYSACCRGVVEFGMSTSKFIYGDSRESMTVHTLLKILASRPVDHLFIDANHEYSSVRADFLNYAPFVRAGGVIGFHDSKWTQAGVVNFLDDLRTGRVIGWSLGTLHEIYFGPRDFATGISYFFKT